LQQRHENVAAAEQDEARPEEDPGDLRERSRTDRSECGRGGQDEDPRKPGSPIVSVGTRRGRECDRGGDEQPYGLPSGEPSVNPNAAAASGNPTTFWITSRRRHSASAITTTTTGCIPANRSSRMVNPPAAKYAAARAVTAIVAGSAKQIPATIPPLIPASR
jgi:hypothetical protein